MAGLSDQLANAMLRVRGHRPRWVSTSVGRVHMFDIRGGGTLAPTVILHGFSAAGSHYLLLIERLLRHVSRMVVPDMPAHGMSDVPRRLEPATIRTGLFEALDATLSEPTVLIGNSMGGLASIRYAVHRPERVRALVLISPAGGRGSPEELEEMHRSFAVQTHTDALAFVDRLFHRPSLLRHAYAVGVRRKFRRPLMRRLLQELEPETLAPETLGELTMPVKVIWGKADRVFPQSHRTFFRDHLLDHAVFDEPQIFGHAPFLDHPGPLTDRILEFLTRC